MRSIPAVTTRWLQWRIAAIPAASSHMRITVPPCTKPAEFASWMLIQRISSEREAAAARGVLGLRSSAIARSYVARLRARSPASLPAP